jgi:hypothetical protein
MFKMNTACKIFSSLRKIGENRRLDKKEKKRRRLGFSPKKREKEEKQEEPDSLAAGCGHRK